MSDAGGPYVFDSGPLSHFAQSGWLGLLRKVTGGSPAWIPQSVHREVSDGVDRHPHLHVILDATWLDVRSISTISETAAFARFTSRLVGSDHRKNVGECETLALAETNSGVAVLDDGAARTVASEFGVKTVTSLGLLCDLVREGHLGLEAAGDVADMLLETEYHLPIGPGGFKIWAVQKGYLEYE